MTSREKMTGMCRRDWRAACCTWLMLATPTRSRTEPTWPARTSSSSVWPGAPFAPVGPDISSCPNFSARVIRRSSASTLSEMEASRSWAAPRAALPAVRAGATGLAPAADTEIRTAATASGVAVTRALRPPVNRGSGLFMTAVLFVEVTSGSRSLVDRHGLHGQVGLRGPGRRVAGEVTLDGVVIEGVVNRGHDHRLVEHEPAVADGARGRVHGVVEAAVGGVDARVEPPQGLDVGVGLLGQHAEREERRVRGHHVLGRAGVDRLRELLAGREAQALDAIGGVVAGVVGGARG